MVKKFLVVFIKTCVLAIFAPTEQSVSLKKKDTHLYSYIALI